MSSRCDAELLKELRHELGEREGRLGSALMSMITARSATQIKIVKTQIADSL